MEKQIALWTYWLGVACLIIGVVWRVVYIWNQTTVLGVGYKVFYDGALMFFLATIATAGYGWVKGQKP